MNPNFPSGPDAPGSGMAAGLVIGMALVLVVMWGFTHGWSRRFPGWRRLCFVGRVVLGSVALAVCWQAVARFFVLETTSPLALHGFIGALAVEGVLALYQLEKRLLPATIGRWLTALRVLAMLAVLTILAQPVFSRKETRVVDRNVIILLDESESMQQADTAMPVGERLALTSIPGLADREIQPLLATRLAAIPALAAKLEAAAGSVRPPDGINEAESVELIVQQMKPLGALLAEAAAWSQGMTPFLDEGKPDVQKLSNTLKQNLRQMRRDAIELFGQEMREARVALERKEGRRLRQALRGVAATMMRSAVGSAALVSAVDEPLYARLPEAIRNKISEAVARPRRDLALDSLLRKPASGLSTMERLQAKYTVRFMKFGRDAAEASGLTEAVPPDSTMRSLTDLTGALTKIQETWPAENLAGVVLLSDVRHNGVLPPDEAARRLGLQGSPLCPVVVGSSVGVRDASIAGVSHPQSIFLGDRLRVKVDLKLEQLRGRTVKVSLSRAGKVVKEENLTVPDDSSRTSLLLDDIPDTKGIFAWKVKIDPVEGEQFSQNNEWSFDAAVSDDRTNVLLIDDHPRWEFRYLRNLFDSRDKSVQLQYVLLHPDLLAGADPPPAIPAAAGRPFGQSEATLLPATAEEWRKFDVIILGDVPPDRVTPETWAIIRDCVGNRGAMLVLVAGQNYLPHAFPHDIAKELIPVKYTASNATFEESPEPAYRLSLTSDGRQSPVFAQSLSGLESARIWEEMPLLRWRHSHDGAKPGASVLAWARPVAVDEQGVELPPRATDGTEADPAGELQRRKLLENRNALVIASQVDLGKVVMLDFDQTWRFRYGVGDTYHHRFWGQLLRWGAGESLPSGTSSVRLGTDQLTYGPGQPVMVRARLMDEQFRPIGAAKVKAEIYLRGKVVASRLLEYRRDSQGLYEGTIGGLTEEASYTVQLSGAEVNRLAAADGAPAVSQPITISNALNPVELGDLSVNPELARKLASLSGGVVTGLADSGAVVDKFGPGTTRVEEQKETSLWDNWLIAAVIIAALTAEWILRQRHSLA